MPCRQDQDAVHHVTFHAVPLHDYLSVVLLFCELRNLLPGTIM